MTREENWLRMWREYMDFVRDHRRRPSKYYPEERDLHNWFKRSKKMLNQGRMPEERIPKFNALLAEAHEFQRLNQYSYVQPTLWDSKEE